MMSCFPITCNSHIRTAGRIVDPRHIEGKRACHPTTVALYEYRIHMKVAEEMGDAALRTEQTSPSMTQLPKLRSGRASSGKGMAVVVAIPSPEQRYSVLCADGCLSLQPDLINPIRTVRRAIGQQASRWRRQ
jgi:hypothetical protein